MKNILNCIYLCFDLFLVFILIIHNLLTHNIIPYRITGLFHGSKII